MKRCLMLVALAASPAVANDDCVSHVGPAEQRYGIPAGLLAAVVHTESGGNPFALNADGAAYFPRTATDAMGLVGKLYARGARNVDVGCGQISMKHHPSFPLSASLDPTRNLDYAAGYLAQLYQQHGSWPTAVAHYHSGDPGRQAVYLTKIDHASITGAPAEEGRAGRTMPASSEPRRFTRVGTLYIDAARLPSR